MELQLQTTGHQAPNFAKTLARFIGELVNVNPDTEVKTISCKSGIFPSWP